MPKHRAFYSFHYDPDNWRAAMVRNIGAVEGNKSAPEILNHLRSFRNFDGTH